MSKYSMGEISKFVSEGLELEAHEELDKESEILDMITNRVLELLDRDPGLLFSYMYRLDVLEHKIQHVLKVQKTVSPHIGLAQLIWERQKERFASKAKYKQKPIEGWEW